MKVLILGSGVVGVSLAYVLAQRGHHVEVIDRQEQSGAETSFANGGQLSYSHAEPWATPGVLAKLPKWLIKSDSPLTLHLRADPDMMLWGLRFLRNCTPDRAGRNGVNLLRLGLYSRLKMQALVAETNTAGAFDYAEHGILHIYATQADLDHDRRRAEFQAKFGCEQRILTREEVLSLEPSLTQTGRPIAGGIHAHMDATGDAGRFTIALAGICEAHGVTFHYNTDITQIHAEGDRITGVHTDRGVHTADCYVMALGAFSPLFLKGLDIRVPIYPMKGYSVTIPANDFTPQISVTDGSRKIVYTRLGDRLRVAGTAEFAGYDLEVIRARVEPIVDASRTLFPKADWDTRLLEWACLRSSTPEGTPLLGRTPIANLFLNTGHGTLGWTQAAGSAYIVADVIEGRQPEITLGGLALGLR